MLSYTTYVTHLGPDESHRLAWLTQIEQISHYSGPAQCAFANLGRWNHFVVTGLHSVLTDHPKGKFAKKSLHCLICESHRAHNNIWIDIYGIPDVVYQDNERVRNMLRRMESF